ncbi:DUF3102 domain-containing protein [Yersinia pseudotuberculosis]|uniref:DUF3102 domain-containing protein n=1 Tax=Yersinia pseudotuberculosis TaxID=633 RepID=UPI0011864DB7|nr:DUF3102 domain-containing protein [Yersinia pseudotuberculosis]
MVHETKFYLSQSAEAMLEAGKRLVVLKENEPYGYFVEIVEEQLGLTARTAQLTMKASLKYLSPKLESKAKSISLLGKTKLFDLMTEDDDELVSLASGGTVAGLTLDEIDRMTSRELRAALRDSRADAEAQSRILADKNSRIDQLTTKLEKQSLIATGSPDPDAEGEALRREVTTFTYAVEMAIRSNLYSGFEHLQEHTNECGIDHGEYMSGCLAQIEFALQQLRHVFDVKQTPNGEVVPAWIREPAPDVQRPDWMGS